MSTNCINCVGNKRTGCDLLCDSCREDQKIINAWRRLAKTALNAFDDCLTACGEGNSKGRPMDLFHRDDWKRMQAWKLEIHNARLAADPDYAARQNTIPEGTT
jgi:hypothetical protein